MPNQSTELQTTDKEKTALERLSDNPVFKVAFIILGGVGAMTTILTGIEKFILPLFRLPIFTYLPDWAGILGAVLFVIAGLILYLVSIRPKIKRLSAENQSLKVELDTNKTALEKHQKEIDRQQELRTRAEQMNKDDKTAIQNLHNRETECLKEKHKEKLNALQKQHEEEQSQKEAVLSETNFLTDRVRTERVDINNYVELSNCVIEKFVDGEVPIIIFGVLIKNKSIFDIRMDNKIDGYINIRDIALRGEKGFVSSYEIVESANHHWLFIEQSLSSEKFEAIKNLQNLKLSDFDLTHLVLIIKGTDKFPQVEPRQMKISRFPEEDRARIVSYKGGFKAEIESLKQNQVSENQKETITEKHPPNLDYIGQKYHTSVKLDDGVFYETRNNPTHVAIFALFENAPKTKQKVGTITEVQAQISYFWSAGGEIARINHGCWADEKQSLVSFPLTGRKKLVLGAFKHGLSNTPTAGLFEIFEYSLEKRKPIGKTVLFGGEKNIDINVRLVMGEHGEFTKDFKFLLHISKDGGFKLTRRLSGKQPPR